MEPRDLSETSGVQRDFGTLRCVKLDTVAMGRAGFGSRHAPKNEAKLTYVEL